jgi:RimJ/RimL family protein N-acetyltransferase
MALTEQQAARIAAAKSAGSSALPIRTNRGTAIGHLVPVTAQRAADPGVIERICRWRDLNKGAFLTVVEADLANTRRYLQDISLPDPARILFLIADLQERLIGNIGLRDVDADSAELDNVVRGEPVTSPDFMRGACAAVLDFGFAVLGIGSVHLSVLADNPRAIELYRRLGFAERGRRALVRQAIAGGYRLVDAELETGDATDLVLVRMGLDEAVFRQRFGAAAYSVTS